MEHGQVDEGDGRDEVSWWLTKGAINNVVGNFEGF